MNPEWFTSWIKASGSFAPVVLRTRAWIHRNLKGRDFGPDWKKNQQEVIEPTIFEAFQSLDNWKEPQKISRLTPAESALILEAGLREPGELEQAIGSYIPQNKPGSGAFTFGRSHLELFFETGGYPGLSWFKNCLDESGELEDFLDFSAHPHWGYLSQDLSRIGSGMNLEFLLHLPALIQTGGLTKALDLAEGRGFHLRGIFIQEEWGNFFTLESHSGLGGAFPNPFSKRLEETLKDFYSLEMKLRKYLLDTKEIELMDQFGRAYGLLRYSRRLNFDESLRAVSQLIWAGSVIKRGHGQVELLVKLLYLIRVGTLKYFGAAPHGQLSPTDELRSRIVRETLESVFGGQFDV